MLILFCGDLFEFGAVVVVVLPPPKLDAGLAVQAGK